MIDDLKYSEDYIEELENELRELRIGHNHLTNELGAIYGSRTYRVGNLARVIYRDPKRVIRKAAKVAKSTGGISPRALRYFKSSTPHDSSIIQAAYKQWQDDFEPKKTELNQQRENVKKFKKQPVFSIITPVFKPPQDVLIELIESVLGQTYPFFELCLGEFAGDEKTRKILQEYSERDSRIKVEFFNENEGISANSNNCLKLATGQYIGLLDHDDLLSPDALYENAAMINLKDYDFIYSDKDKIDEKGLRFDPMFKPDWSPELMLTANYLTHFNVFKRSTLEKIGGWDKQTDGAQDWDLFFRLISKSKNIGHIPKILYHWRVIATSTALSITTKPYALEGQRRAIAKYIDYLGIMQPEVRHSKQGALSLRWGHNTTEGKKIHFIISTEHETLGNAYRLQKKLTRTKYFNKNITIINENSEDSFGSKVRILANENDALIFINPNVTAFERPEWIEELLGWLSLPGVGVVSPHVYSRFGYFLEGGRIVGMGSAATPLFAGDTYIPGIFGYREWSRNVTLPSMNCFAVSASALKSIEIGQSGIQGLREIVLKLALDDYRVVVTPFDSVTLSQPAIYEPVMSDKNQRLIKKLLPDLRDPFYSDNLSVNYKYPMFNKKEEVNFRVELQESYLSKVIEYDPAQENIQDLAVKQEALRLVGYRRDAYILSKIADCTTEEILESKKITDDSSAISKIDTAIWYLPNFTTMYAGLKNIFALANRLMNDEGTKHTFYIATQENVDHIRDLVSSVYPSLADARYINAKEYGQAKMSSHTIGICSLWTTAYDLLKNNKLQRKLYLIQDDERSFYPRGTLYGLVNSSYEFGFWGITGTDALSNMYRSEFKQQHTVTLGSELDLKSYLSTNRNYKNKIPRVLFYARPDAPRNGFELGLNGLNRLAEKMKEQVEIVLAGADFDVSQYANVNNCIKQAGKVPYTELASFYTSFDAALFLMFSEHPGVFALEMMASSCPVVVNKHHNEAWSELYVDKETCLVATPTASSIAESLHQVLTDLSLRETLIKNGHKLAQRHDNHLYETQVQKTISIIKNGK